MKKQTKNKVKKKEFEYEEENIFEVLDKIADNYGHSLTPDSFSDLFTKVIIIYGVLGITTFLGFYYFDELGILGTFALMWIVLIDIFTIYCEIFRRYVIF
jgi:hypothetical protein